MDRQAILNLFKDCDFNFICRGEVEGVITNLPSDFSCSFDSGESKLVIIPDNEHYVIKIPFTNYSISGDYNDFQSANLTSDRYYDYCLTETLMYQAAKSKKIEKAFAKERCIGEVHDRYIYVQEKAVPFKEFGFHKKIPRIKEEILQSSPLYDTVIETTSFVGVYSSNEFFKWLIDLTSYFSTSFLNRFCEFISDYGIDDDLHYGNFGYIGKRPVLIDYSSFCG